MTTGKPTGRPRIDDALLKNPRSKYKRKSNHKSIQLDIPEPSAKELARWAPIARLCWERVIANPSSHVAAKKNMIVIAWRSHEDIPVAFPRGRNVENKLDKRLLKKYNAEAVLMWLWERKLAPRSVSELYKLRTSAIASALGEFNIGNGLLLEHDAGRFLAEIDVDE